MQFQVADMIHKRFAGFYELIEMMPILQVSEDDFNNVWWDR
jgi:hypothetical protein